MRNYIQSGDTLTVSAPVDVLSGQGVLVGKLFGIACFDAKAGDEVEIRRKGVYDHGKTPAQAWAVGADIYWDATTKVFTTTSTGGNTLVAKAVAVAANPSDFGRVVLNG